MTSYFWEGFEKRAAGAAKAVKDVAKATKASGLGKMWEGAKELGNQGVDWVSKNPKKSLVGAAALGAGGYHALRSSNPQNTYVHM